METQLASGKEKRKFDERTLQEKDNLPTKDAHFGSFPIALLYISMTRAHSDHAYNRTHNYELLDPPTHVDETTLSCLT